jgi:hypothetical protein
MLHTRSRWLMSIALAALALVAINLLVATTPTQARHASLINCAGSIQACIDAANEGDTILIAAGRYTESLTLSKPVSLTGENRDTTIIHAVAGQRVLTVTGAAIGNSVVISGLTFTGGSADYGGGIYTDSPLTVQNAWFVSNTADAGNGGGLFANDAITIVNSGFMSNTGSPAGGLRAVGNSATLINTDFMANDGGAMIWAQDNTPSDVYVTGGQFIRNSAGGLAVYGSLEMTGTHIISNSGTSGVRVWAGAARLQNVQFEYNHCTECDAGGLYFYGWGIEGNFPLALSSTSFVSNSPSGAYVYQGSIVTVSESRFEHNFAPLTGGALWAYDSPLLMIRTEVVSNTAVDGTGGVTAHPTTILIDSHFEDNRSNGSFGGGLWTGELFLTDTNFINNAAAAGGGALAWKAHLNGGRFEHNTAQAYGGGLATSELFISGTVFVSNTAQLGGGGGALTYGTTLLQGGKFENNRAFGSQNDVYGGNGGGLVVAAGPLLITGTQFIKNSTGGIGGGLFYTETTDSRIINALFVGNTADIDGAAIAIDSMGQHEILHSTIAGSSPITQSAITVLSGTLKLTNTIIASHTIGISNTGGTVYEDYNLFFGNITNTVGVTSGGHSLVGDPKFVDPLNGDYHVLFGSAAIDRGVDVGVYTDLDGKPRPIGAGFDIGAYEYQAIKVLYLPLIRR